MLEKLCFKYDIKLFKLSNVPSIKVGLSSECETFYDNSHLRTHAKIILLQLRTHTQAKRESCVTSMHILFYQALYMKRQSTKNVFIFKHITCIPV